MEPGAVGDGTQRRNASGSNSMLLYGFAPLASLPGILVGYLLTTNEPPRPGVGLRTLNDPALRREAEKRLGRWYMRLGSLWIIVIVVLFFIARLNWIAIVCLFSTTIIYLAPLLAVRPKNLT